MMKPHIQALCDKLVTNDPSFTELTITIEPHDEGDFLFTEDDDHRSTYWSYVFDYEPDELGDDTDDDDDDNEDQEEFDDVDYEPDELGDDTDSDDDNEDQEEFDDVDYEPDELGDDTDNDDDNEDQEEFDDDDLELVFDATGKNHTVEKLTIINGYLSVHAALALASAVLMHPKMKELSFYAVEIEDFCAVAVAFYQNDNLTHLTFQACTLSSSLLEYVRCLLSANSLVALAIMENSYEETELPDLSRVLLCNWRLKELALLVHNQPNMNISPETIQEIPILLGANKNIQTLKLNGITLDSGMVRLIAKAVEGHKTLSEIEFVHNNLQNDAVESIGNMLRNAPALRIFLLAACPLGTLGDIGCRQLMSGLTSESSLLEKIDLPANHIGYEGARLLSDVIKATQTLKSLSLCNNHIRNAGASVLAGALKHNNTLKDLDLSLNRIGSKGAVALSHALCSNISLKKFNLIGNPIGDDGAVHFADMLTKNTSLEYVLIAGGFGKSGVKAIVASLPHVHGLKTLALPVNGSTPEIANDLIKAIEQNTTLEHFIACGGSYWKNWQHPEVNHLLALNRGGRRILKSPSVPRSLWPRILGRCAENANALFFFLREKSDAIFGGGRDTRKRKQKDVTF